MIIDVFRSAIYFIFIILGLQSLAQCKDVKQPQIQNKAQEFQSTKDATRIKESIVQCLKNARKKFVQLKAIKEWSDNKDKHRQLVKRFRDLQARIYQELAKRRYKSYSEKKLFTKSKLLQELFSKHKKYFQNLRDIVKRNCNQDMLDIVGSTEIDMLVGCGYSIAGHCLACLSHVDYDTSIRRLDDLQRMLSGCKFKKKGDLELAAQEIKKIKSNYIKANVLCRDLDGYCGCIIEGNSIDDTRDPIGIKELRYMYDHLDTIISNIKLIPMDNSTEYMECLLDNSSRKPSKDSVKSWVNILNTSKAVSILHDKSIEISKQDIDKIISGIDKAIKKLNDGVVKSIIDKMDVILNEADRRYILKAHKAGFISSASDSAVYIASHRISMCILDDIFGTVSFDNDQLIRYINCISFMLDYIDSTNKSLQDKDTNMVKYKDLRHYPCAYHGERGEHTIRHDKYFITNKDNSDVWPNKCDSEQEWCAHLYPYGYRNYYSYGSVHTKYNEISEAAIADYEAIKKEIGGIVGGSV